MNLPLFGEITCKKSVVWSHGLIISQFSRALPTSQLCIVLLESEADISRGSWEYPNVHREFHVFLHVSTILRQLATLLQPETLCLKDCRWAILKQLERTRNICACCGRQGHSSDVCFRKFCTRCGRLGHKYDKCFARTNVLGQSIDLHPYTCA